MPLITDAGGTVFAELTGDDDDQALVVALHGWGRDRRDLVGVLGDHRVLAVDLPGFGTSPPSSGPVGERRLRRRRRAAARGAQPAPGGAGRPQLRGPGRRRAGGGSSRPGVRPGRRRHPAAPRDRRIGRLVVSPRPLRPPDGAHQRRCDGGKTAASRVGRLPGRHRRDAPGAGAGRQRGLCRPAGSGRRADRPSAGARTTLRLRWRRRAGHGRWCSHPVVLDVVEGSGHDVHLSRPERVRAVVDAVVAAGTTP